MAGPLVWEFAEDFAATVGPVALLTGHPDTLAKPRRDDILVFPAVAYSRESYQRRAISWLTYCAQAFIWLWRWPKTTPILLFTNPPLLLWLGFLLRILRGTAICDNGIRRLPRRAREAVEDIGIESGMIRLWRWLNGRAYARAELVMTLSRDMQRTLEKHSAANRALHPPIEIISPWADTARIRPLPKQENWFAKKYAAIGKLTVMYSGNMSMSHDIETLLLVAEQMKQDQEVHFLFIGSGPKWNPVATAKTEKDLFNVTLLPWQAEEVIPFSLAAADVAFISLQEELAGISFPARTFSFLAAGVPLLVSCSEESELADIISRFGCGWKVRPKDASALLQLLEWIRENPAVLEPARRASRRAAEEIGSRQNSRMMVDLVSRTFRLANPVERSTSGSFIEQIQLRNAFSQTFHTAIGIVFLQAIAFVTTILIARSLSPEQLGRFQLTISISIFVTMLGPLGLDEAVAYLLPKYARTATRESLRAYRIHARGNCAD